MIVKSYLIADSPIYGNNQVVSRTIRHPWAGCTITEELEAANKEVIRESMRFIQEHQFTNVREVRNYYKANPLARWKMLDRKIVRRDIVRFGCDNF